MSQVPTSDGKLVELGVSVTGGYMPGRWSYAAAASGISNTTTAVTIAAAVPGYKNTVHAIQVSADALGTATELAIRDGAGGSAIWRMKLTTAGLPQQACHYFPVPLHGSAGNLLEVVTITATTTGSVYFNAQGGTAV